MKRNISTILILSLISILLLVISIIFFFITDLRKYILITFILFIITITLVIFYINNTKSEESIYKSTINNIFKSYYQVLSEISEIPNIVEKDIIKMNSIDDLLIAQEEINKPIFYKTNNLSTVFLLIDDNLVCIYILKISDKVITPIETLLSKKKIYKLIDEKLLNTIKEPTVIKLHSNKLLKVIPINDIGK